MAIFSKLTIQNVLMENAEFMSDIQMHEHKNRLKKNDIQSIDTEWEIVVLNAFSKIGKVNHEIALSDGSKPDIHFINEDFEFYADVTAVNDDNNIENENPLKPFERLLLQKLEKAGLTAAGFHIVLNTASNTSKYAAKLSLPNKSEFQSEIFGPEFKKYLNEIKRNAKDNRALVISKGEIHLKMEYTPGNPYFSLSHPNYRAPTELTKNSLYNSLKNKAQGQLRNIPTGKIKGIIACDADCHIFNQPTQGWNVTHLTKEMIISEFLRQNQSVDFVVTLRSGFLKQPRYSFDLTNRSVLMDVFLNSNLPVNEEKLIFNTMENMQNGIPKPSNTAEGARETIKMNLKPNGTMKNEQEGP